MWALTYSKTLRNVNDQFELIVQISRAPWIWIALLMQRTFRKGVILVSLGIEANLL